MHLSTLLTSLVTFGLITLTSAAALDNTTSVSTSCSTSELSSTYSASASASVSTSTSESTSTSKSTTTTSASSSTGSQTIEEYIKDKLSQNDTDTSNSTTNNITSIKRVQGHGMTIEVPTCCWNGCRTCSSKVCGKGANGCNQWPYYSCCATIIIWDIGRDAVLDAFTTAGETVEFQDD